jgi:lauroyl/myristoyl acyltransferase
VTSEAIDLRERGGAWGTAQTIKNDLLYGVIRAALGACRLASPRVLAATGRGMGRVAHVLFGGARRAALANVARAIPDLDAGAFGPRSGLATR